MGWTIGLVLVGLLVAVAAYDVTQRRHAILRNFPILGHFRYLFESVGPELRQYIVTSNDEERPFSRDQRRWVYASSKGTNNYFGFGTDNDLETTTNYLILKHAPFPMSDPLPGEPSYDPHYGVPAAKVIGGPRGRRHAFRPRSAVMVSGMSFGSLSGPAVEAINRGCAAADCLQSTGEGGLSEHHRHGGRLMWQLGTGYFGARTPEGRFDLATLVEACASAEVAAIEIKLSQGAKPGRGGVLPAAKITPEIAAIRGIPLGRDCISPAAHREFSDADSLLDFVERLADATGLPVGIKSAVGDLAFWETLADSMVDGSRGVDFIQIDGGEGGTGAAPLVFSDHVALPFKQGFARVYRIFVERGVADRVTFVGSGRLGFPVEALLAMTLGCDVVAVAREAMLAVGCIQAQRCHTGHCPTGVATQNRWLTRGLDPMTKAVRLTHYIETLRKELLWLARAAGHAHPALVTADQLEVLDGAVGARTAAAVYGYEQGWGLPGAEDRAFLERLGTTGS